MTTKLVKDLTVGDIFVNEGPEQTIHMRVVREPFEQDPGTRNIPVTFKGMGSGGPMVCVRPENLEVTLVEKATLGYIAPSRTS